VKGVKSSKDLVTDNYPGASYAQKQFSSPKTYDYHQNYEAKYATKFNSSYQVCEKFDSILNLTKKEFPET